MLKLLKYIFIDILAEIVYFPIWWYTRGLLKLVKNLFQELKNQSRALALGLWLKNLLKPMYGDCTREGRMVSFFMRVVILKGRLIILAIYAVILVLVLVFYLGLMPGAVYLIVRGI